MFRQRGTQKRACRAKKKHSLRRKTVMRSEAALTPVERRLTKDRKTVIHMMRRSYAEVEKNLSPDMEDACNEIEVGFNCIAGHMGYPDSDLSRVKGGEHGGFQEWSIHMSKKLTEWRNEVDPKLTGAVIDYVVFGKPFKIIAIEAGCTRQTASNRFYSGLREYCKMFFT